MYNNRPVSTTAITASYSPLQATGSVYKPWDELDEDAKITTSAAAKNVRRCRFPRDTNRNNWNPSLSVEIEQNARQLVGDIYDAMISVDRALDDPQQWAIRPFTMLSEQGLMFPYIPEKSVVAMAYLVAYLIIDGYESGFRTVLQSGSQYEYQGWPQRKATLLAVLRSRKASVAAILSLNEKSVLALIFDPRAWDAARPIAHPKQGGPRLLPGCRPFATLHDSNIPKNSKEITKYRDEMFGYRMIMEPYLLGHPFVQDERFRAAWVKKAYDAFVTPKDPNRPDDHSLLSSIEHFQKRKAWSESYIVARLWKIADILEDGARHGFICMHKPNFFACRREYELDSNFNTKLNTTIVALTV
ncbi:hypothetical protein SLS58_005407 [Diplodia intermedia]|uniref:Uncharacterized protein n=1 Tax=Diplodia intermedia TaxID=856260 RepID=A0ABR3TS16_9PEZI